MSIKQSALERKWYFRLAKVFFSILPVVAIVYFLYSHQGEFPAVLLLIQKGSFLDLAKKYGVYFGFWILLYPLIITTTWQIFVYIFFGGLENDMVRENKESEKRIQSGATNNTGPAILILIIIILFAIFYYADKTEKDKLPDKNKINPNGTSSNRVVSTPKLNPTNAKDKPVSCIPTGCGSFWRCTGNYYFEGRRIDINGCYPDGMRPSDVISGWSGTCRKCP